MKNITRFRVRYPEEDAAGQHKVANAWLEESVAADLLRARDHLDTLKPGSQLILTDWGRTYAQQVALKKAKPDLAANPGTSRHEGGMAVDVAVGELGDTLAAILHQYDPATWAGAPAEQVSELQALYAAAQHSRQRLVEAYLGQFGFKRVMEKEPWHFDSDRIAGRSTKELIKHIGNTEGRP